MTPEPQPVSNLVPGAIVEAVSGAAPLPYPRSYLVDAIGKWQRIAARGSVGTETRWELWRLIVQAYKVARFLRAREVA